MTRVLITREIPNPAEQMLKEAGHEVIIASKKGLSKEELISALKEQTYDALLPLLTDTIDAEVFDAMPSSMKIIANYAVGYDNIDVAEAEKRGITVSNTPEVLTESVAEHTIALLLAIARRIVESDTFVREGRYTGWEPDLLLGANLEGKTLGILGAGRIGTRVAEIARNGFGMNILYYDVKQSEEIEKIADATFHSSLEEVLENADVVTVHVPLLDATHHLIGAEELAKMKESAFLINTSRGEVIDEKALVSALSEKTITGAALDVFENEPDLTPGLSELSNVVLTPHTASAAIETRQAMAQLAAENIIAALEGKEPPSPVKSA